MRAVRGRVGEQTWVPITGNRNRLADCGAMSSKMCQLMSQRLTWAHHWGMRVSTFFGLTPQQRLHKAGVLSYTFWLHKVLHEHVKLLLSKYLTDRQLALEIRRAIALDKVDKIVT